MPHNTGVSVLLPVYLPTANIDDVRPLADAIDSVLSQATTAPLEIIVIDDGGPTPVRELMPSYAKLGNVRWLRSPRNSGLVDALNRGLAEARYTLIARIDADDVWETGKLAKQLAMFQEDPDLTIVGTGMTRVKSDGGVIDRHVRGGDWASILRFLVEVGCPFPHGSIVASKRTFTALGGYAADPEVRHCEDFELWSRWLRFFKPAMVEEPLYRYRVTDQSISSRHAQTQGEASGRIQKRFVDLAIADTLPADLKMLARTLDVPLVAAGELALLVWQQCTPVLIPEPAVPSLQAVLPDRDIRPAQTAASSAWDPRQSIPEFSGENKGHPVIAWPVS